MITVDRTADGAIVTCDFCDISRVALASREYESMLSELRSRRWRVGELASDGGWRHMCPNCGRGARTL